VGREDCYAHRQADHVRRGGIVVARAGVCPGTRRRPRNPDGHARQPAHDHDHQHVVAEDDDLFVNDHHHDDADHDDDDDDADDYDDALMLDAPGELSVLSSPTAGRG
jgi:hypothetical protein